MYNNNFNSYQNSFPVSFADYMDYQTEIHKVQFRTPDQTEYKQMKHIKNRRFIFDLIAMLLFIAILCAAFYLAKLPFYYYLVCIFFFLKIIYDIYEISQNQFGLTEGRIITKKKIPARHHTTYMMSIWFQNSRQFCQSVYFKTEFMLHTDYDNMKPGDIITVYKENGTLYAKRK